MPRKARRPKRRAGDEAERNAWSVLFENGYDYFHDLDVLGLTTEEKKRAAARGAWGQFGAIFMANWLPSKRRSLPWAHEEFGAP